MLERWLIPAAVVVFLGVAVGCIVSAPPDGDAQAPRAKRTVSSTLRAQRTTGLPFRGVAMQLHRVDWMETEYRRSVDEVVALGADSVFFVVDARMENGSSSRIYLDFRFTPPGDKLMDLIKYAKSKQLRVALMPIVLLDKPRKSTEWRGTIQPDDWADWWQSYRGMMYHYCVVAENGGADLLVIGSELVSTESHAGEWNTTIAEIRKVFRGMLTYSANWDHYKQVPFWDQMDIVAMNSYWTLGRDRNASLGEIEKNWRDIQNNVMAFQREVGKPLIFTEVGWCSQANAASEPWDYTQDDVPIDMELQRRLWEGFFKSWHGQKGFGGFFVWEWPVGDGGPNDRGYTPEGKPAEAVIREWFAKPRWQVN